VIKKMQIVKENGKKHKFVIQQHRIGQRRHYDLRVLLPANQQKAGKEVTGFTLLIPEGRFRDFMKGGLVVRVVPKALHSKTVMNKGVDKWQEIGKEERGEVKQVITGDANFGVQIVRNDIVFVYELFLLVGNQLKRFLVRGFEGRAGFVMVGAIVGGYAYGLDAVRKEKEAEAKKEGKRLIWNVPIAEWVIKARPELVPSRKVMERRGIPKKEIDYYMNIVGEK
jgi:hypothetical protein